MRYCALLFELPSFVWLLLILFIISENAECLSEDSWLEDEVLAEVSRRYPNFIVLPVTSTPANTKHGMVIFWSIIDEIEIRLAVAARIDDNGWIGFGLAEAGGMPGSDIFVYHAGNDSVVDMYATAYDSPHVDDAHQQDWLFVNSTKGHGSNDGWITCEVKRLLDTGDTRHDRQILNKNGPEPHRVIGAWGHDTWGYYHGPNQRVRGSLNFFANNQQHSQSSSSLLFHQAMATQANRVLEIINNNFTIPTQTTTNVKFCFTLSQDFPNVLSSSDGVKNLLLHGIGIEPIIGSSTHVHHMVLTGSTIDYGNVPRTGYGCDHLFDQESDSVYAIQGWAAGQGPVLVPPQAGIPLAGGDYLSDNSGAVNEADDFGGYKSFRLYIHYDNRLHIQNAIDPGSGFKIYATNSLRQYAMGIFIVGHGELEGVAVGSDDDEQNERLRFHEFTCPSTCTEYILSPPEPVSSTPTNATPQEMEMVVVDELLHMHETGTRMVNRVLDKNGTIKHEGWIDYWDVAQSGLFPTSSGGGGSSGSFTLAAGDSIITRCYFDATKSSKENTRVTFWGDGSQDEMCLVFLWYYPRRHNAASCGYGIRQKECFATHISARIDHDTQLDRVFGITTPAVPTIFVPNALEGSPTPTPENPQTFSANSSSSTTAPDSHQ